ncbi:hypothetical protein I3842_10G097400 [Carya illinoinensis]|uniref:Senescence regulator n=1 Tax=Carya illinoinensis TaxID=32201 RepID=A0A922J3H0_CARIL|nr:hypothetical protein I3842_10G097400 [Carya illinoinensis]
MAKELEELQECDVIFPDHHHRRHHQLNQDSTFSDFQEMGSHNKSKKSNSEKRMANSPPVRIPDTISRRLVSDDLEDAREGGEMVPPHVIIKRRIAGKMAFSLCTGNGRTLKGRDLSHVRNSILRMTGFLET